MEFKEPNPFRVVPQGDPPEGLVPLSALEVASTLTAPLRRSFLWAAALIRAGFESRIALPPRFIHFSAGFVRVQSHLLASFPRTTPLQDDFVFGAMAVAEGEGLQRLETLQVGSYSFPLAISRGRLEMHGTPPRPSKGTSTCWVKNVSGTGSWQRGIVTCRHVVTGARLGSAVHLTPSAAHAMPVRATFADETACTIDAAILEISKSDWPPGLKRLPVLAPAAPGQVVRLTDRHGVTHDGSVLSVFHYGTYVGNLFGQRIVTDVHGAPGDSGSLLETTTYEGVGVYMGTIPDGNGGLNGIHQDLHQASAYFGFDAYV